MKIKKIYLIILLFLNSFLGEKLFAQDLFDIIKLRIDSNLVASAGDIADVATNVKASLRTLNVNTGIWSDINYQATDRTNPSWGIALDRLQKMAVAYSTQGSGNLYYQSPSLRLAINNALDYFCSLRPVPRSANWFRQGIARPRSLVSIIILMEYGAQPLDPAVKQKAINAMCLDTAVNAAGRNNPLHVLNDGANKTAIALNWIYMSTILRSNYMLQVGAQQIFFPVAYTNEDGIRYDLSHTFHKNYLYLGNYGLVMMGDVANAAYLLRGTTYSLSSSKLSLFRRYVLETEVPVVRGSIIDWNVVGRMIAAPSNIIANKYYLGPLAQMQQIDPENASLYGSAISRITNVQPPSYGIQPRNRHYFAADYTLHTRPGYTFSVHAVSSRTKYNERGNGENLKGLYLGAGATNIQLKGDEYLNTFPLWNWTYIPGTTAPDSLVLLPPTVAPGNSDRYGTSVFAGGVSDSLYGATGHIMNNDMLTSAKKAWFQFDNEIVCLGAGISSASNKNINTTVNQVLLRNTTFPISVGGKTTTLGLGNPQTYNNKLDWVLQDSVGYVFPNGGNLQLLAEHRSGNWLSINTDGASSNNTVEEKNIFQLFFSHGIRPSGATYAYIVVPNKGSANDMTSYVAAKDISIGVNSDSVQAVNSKSLHMWQMVFYKAVANYANDSMKVWTSVPSAVILKRISPNRYLLHIADPTHQASTVTFYAKLPGLTGTKFVNISLPSGNYAGQSATAFITESSSRYDTAVGNLQPLKANRISYAKNATSVDKILLYPNPVHDQLLVNGIGRFNSLSLQGIDGKILYRTILTGENTCAINVNHLAPGVYFVVLASKDNNIKTFKVMKY
ncbi:polysaccharide lyase family 8 super-sandwich domain-containing protein [Chitinophaga polysaccharea]|uniref:polysaccharide lyase family 8 super-sandwich domain-containing protein n=1 Tax=Chitinophaga polysaccharea TaxID=1293035 RepID=UPI00115BF9B6|nr:polysaccharide lyase family 8 super-sandwich domain-containing protein [Chitinophaga polysaccharea]